MIPRMDADHPESHDANHAYSVSEAADHLGVTPGTVRAHLRQGTLLGEKIEGSWVVFLPIPRRANATIADNAEDGPAAPFDTGYPQRTGRITRFAQQVIRLLVRYRQRLGGYLRRIPKQSVHSSKPTDT
jgi:hypothetical protein